MQFSKKVYDVLKSIAMIWLPAASALYTTLSGIWHLPSTIEVAATATAVDTFLGVLLGISSASYRANPPVDGHMVVDVSEDQPRVTSVNVIHDPQTVAAKKTITLAVKSAKNENPAAPVSM
jgi:Putative phage holin Dp-1